MTSSEPEQDLQARLIQAASLYANGDWDAAIETYTLAIAQYPANAPAYVMRGLILREQGDTGEAARDFDRAIEIDPNYGPAYYGRGWVRHMLGDYEGELADALKGIELEPQDANKYNIRIGSAYHGLKRYPEALEAYSRAITNEPDVEGPIYNRGLLYVDMGQYEFALADFSRALELDPDWDWAFAARGRVYLLLGDNESAVRDFRSVMQVSGSPMIRGHAQQMIQAIDAERTRERKGLLGLLTLRPEAFRELANDYSPGEMVRSTLLVLGLVVIMFAAPIILTLPGTGTDRLITRLTTQYNLTFDQAKYVVLGSTLVVAPIFWLASGWVLSQATRLSFVGGAPRFSALLRTTSYAAVFSLISLIPNSIADFVGSALGWVAYIIAISEALRISIRKAFALACSSIIFVMVPLVLLAMFISWKLVVG